MNDLSLHLTEPNQQLGDLRRNTAPGMAHWAGTGPHGKTCRECSHWTGCGVHSGYYARGGKHGGKIRPRACAKFRALMQMQIIGQAVEHDRSACRHFEASEQPPAAFDK